MKKKLFKKSLFGLVALLFPSCSKTNPTNASFITADMKKSLNTIKRLDLDGFLYEMDYTNDYYDQTILDLVKNIKVDTGCSAFTMFNQSNNYVFCRNYDYKHNDPNGNATGANLFIRTSPKNKLKSIAMCDTYFLNSKEYYKGALDDGKTDLSTLIVSPFACTDGMNEAGVSCGLFALDTKTEKGEKATNQNTGKERAMQAQLMRYILDNAHNLEEAINIAKQYDVFSLNGSDVHMMISDKNGNSAVLEWRAFESAENQTLKVTYTNAITNFYVGFDDAQDMYNKDGSLREKFTKLETTWNTYHYGYGHGYHRFSGIVSALDRYTNEQSKTINDVKQAQLTEDQAKNILSVAAQEPGFEKTSYTQFSCLYNLEKKSLELYSQRDYSTFYSFTI